MKVQLSIYEIAINRLRRVSGRNTLDTDQQMLAILKDFAAACSEGAFQRGHDEALRSLTTCTACESPTLFAPDDDTRLCGECAAEHVSGKIGQLVVDPFLRWCEVNNKTLREKYPHMFIAVDLPYGGVVVAAKTDAEFIEKINKLPKEQQERVFRTHTSAFV